jgi:hypothetical protein
MGTQILKFIGSNESRAKREIYGYDWALVAHACNSSYSGGRDEDHSSKSALGK